MPERGGFEVGEAQPAPPLALLVKSSLLFRLERVDAGAVLLEEPVVVPEAERLVFDLELQPAEREVLSHAQEFARGDAVEPELVEEPQEPWRALGEVGGLAVRVPHLHGA